MMPIGAQSIIWFGIRTPFRQLGVLMPGRREVDIFQREATLSAIGKPVATRCYINHVVPFEIKGLKYFSLSEAADQANVTRQTLWRWRQERKVPMGHKYRGRQVIYTPAEVRGIEEFANRIDPIDPPSPGQRDLFDDF